MPDEDDEAAAGAAHPDAAATLAAHRDEMLEMAARVRAVFHFRAVNAGEVEEDDDDVVDDVDEADVEKLFNESADLAQDMESARLQAVLDAEVDGARAEALYTGYGETSGIDEMAKAWHQVDDAWSEMFDEWMKNAREGVER